MLLKNSLTRMIPVAIKGKYIISEGVRWVKFMVVLLDCAVALLGYGEA